MKYFFHKIAKLMSARILAIGLTFIQTLLITRVFGIELFGILSFSLSISALAILLLSVGLDQILMRDVARLGKLHFFISQRWQDIRRLILWGIVPLTLVTAIVGTLFFKFTEFGRAYTLLLITIFLLLPVILARKYFEAISLGAKKAVRSIIGSQIVYPTMMILGGIFVWFMHVTPDEISVSITYSIAAISSLVASFLLILGTLREMQGKVSLNDTINTDSDNLPKKLRSKALIKSGMHFSLVSIGFILGQHIDVLLIGLLSTPENVALVRVATRVAEIAGLMRAIILLQYKPLLAEAYGKNDVKLLQRQTTSMVKFFVMTGVPITCILWLFAEEIMSIFGPEFILGAWTMRIYVAGVLVTLLCGPGVGVLSMSDNESVASRILLISLGLHIIFNMILIPLLGIIGCASANFLSMCFLSFASRWITIKKIGVETSIISIFSVHAGCGKFTRSRH